MTWTPACTSVRLAVPTHPPATQRLAREGMEAHVDCGRYPYSKTHASGVGDSWVTSESDEAALLTFGSPFEEGEDDDDFNADYDYNDLGCCSSVRACFADDAVSVHRSAFMERSTLHIGGSAMPYPSWEENAICGDMCFDLWPDWDALVARTREDAAVAAAILSQAAEVLGGSNGSDCTAAATKGKERYAAASSSPAQGRETKVA
mmetsp:Transcript_14526/g.23907  ORF Transcript_14526/g.23907 Transcript_14526/m.23907 type:complete len:205 (-) Transcript_14526:310-924(-)